MKNTEKTMEKIVALCKGRGFVFAGSEIYGGLANTWDYGPLGVELKNNVKKAWWKKFVQENHYNVGLDAAILMNPQVWVASGHVGGFSDPLMDCKECKERFRADKVIEDWCAEHGFTLPKPVDALSQAEMKAFVEEHQIPCPSCGKHNWTDIRQFNLMFKTFQGVTEDAKNTVYLRPETAQGIFVNFQNVQRTTRKKLPFGVCQVGKSFRNEITPGNFTFRTREFEQMELEFFCQPGTELEWFNYWKQFCHQWLLDLGLKDENLRLRDHDPEELSHYSNATTDFEFVFPFGWGELWGVASRTNFDLTQHQNTSGKDLTYFDQEKNEHYIPYVIEPSLGADRVTLAFLIDAYDEEVVDAEKNDVRTVLRLHPALAPFKCAVLPLSKKLGGKAMEIRDMLAKDFMVDYDEAGSIGKRYRRQDEIGTPFCVTVDFHAVGTDTEEADHCVTVRDRDTMEQVRMPISELKAYLAGKMAFWKKLRPRPPADRRCGGLVLSFDPVRLPGGAFVVCWAAARAAARRGRRFLFRKKAARKTDRGSVARCPLKVRPDGLIREALSDCKSLAGEGNGVSAYEAPGELVNKRKHSLPTKIEAGGFRKHQTKTSRQRRKTLTDMGTHLC